MASETLIVPRAPFDMEEPWATPSVCDSVRLRGSTDAAAPRLATSVAAWYDDQALTVLFSAADDFIVATYLGHDDPLYEQDVVEVFLAPDGLARYYEIEVSPKATVFDARIDSPDGVRATMRTDRAWTCEGLFAAVRIVTETGGEMSVDVVVRLPFASLGRPAPREWETWRGNFYRIDRHPSRKDEFSAWQPTHRRPPDFHVPASFGVLRFGR